jgi:hypothetical protein
MKEARQTEREREREREREIEIERKTPGTKEAAAIT